MSNAAADLSADDRARLEAAHRELREAVADYERFLGGGDTELPPGVEAAQTRVQAAEDHLWQLREEILGWSRPAWAPSATLVADWFSEEDAIYDDLPETTAP